MPLKLCKDCKHYVGKDAITASVFGHGPDECWREAVMEESRVTGERRKFGFIRNASMERGHRVEHFGHITTIFGYGEREICGPDGKYWEPKP